MAASTMEEARRERNTLRTRLWDDPIFAHNWICHHHDNTTCADGCDKAGKASRISFYNSPIEEL